MSVPAIHPLGKHALVVPVTARVKVTIDREALGMLLDPEPGLRKTRVPIMRGRDHEAGDVTLSKTGRTVVLSVREPQRLFLAKTAHVRALLAGELNAARLVDATDEDDAGLPQNAEDAEARKARLADLARRTRERLGGAS